MIHCRETKMRTSLTGLSVLMMIMISTQAMGEEDTEIENRITGWIDGEPATWVLQTDRLTPSAVFFSPTHDTRQFHIHAYQDERFRREGSLYLELTIREDSVDVVSLHYFPFSQLHPRFSFGSDHGSGQLTLDSLVVEPRNARLAARFSGQLYYHQSPNTDPIVHRTLPMRIQLDLTAYRE